MPNCSGILETLRIVLLPEVILQEITIKNLKNFLINYVQQMSETRSLLHYFNLKPIQISHSYYKEVYN